MKRRVITFPGTFLGRLAGTFIVHQRLEPYLEPRRFTTNSRLCPDLLLFPFSLTSNEKVLQERK